MVYNQKTIENNISYKDIANNMKKWVILALILSLLSYPVLANNFDGASLWMGQGGNDLNNNGFQTGKGNIGRNISLNIFNNSVNGMDFQPLVADFDWNGDSEIVIFDAGKLYLLNPDLTEQISLSLTGSAVIASQPALSFWYSSNRSVPHIAAILKNNSNTKYYYQTFTYNGTHINKVQTIDITSIANAGTTSYSGTGGIRCSINLLAGGVPLSNNGIDADNDGKADCIFDTWNGTLAAFDIDSTSVATATLKYFRPLNSIDNGTASRSYINNFLDKVSAPNIQDIDRDGDLDIAWTANGEIYVADELGNFGFIKNITGGFVYSPQDITIEPHLLFANVDTSLNSDKELISIETTGFDTNHLTNTINLYESNGVLRSNINSCKINGFAGNFFTCSYSRPIYQHISTGGTMDFGASSLRKDILIYGRGQVGINSPAYIILAFRGDVSTIFTADKAIAAAIEGEDNDFLNNADIDNNGKEDIIGMKGLYEADGDLIRNWGGFINTPTFLDADVMPIPVDIDNDLTLDIIMSKDGFTTIIRSSAIPQINGTLIGLGCTNTSLKNPLLFCEPFSYADSILNHCQPTTFSTYCWLGIDVSPNGFELPITDKSLNFNYHFLTDKDRGEITESRTPIVTMKFNLNKYSAKSQEDLFLTANSPVAAHIINLAWRDGTIYQLNPSNSSYTKLTSYTNNTYFTYYLTLYLINDTARLQVRHLNGTIKYTNNNLRFMNPVSTIGWFIWQYDVTGSTSKSDIKLDEIFVYRGVNNTFNLGKGITDLVPVTTPSCFNSDGIDICKNPAGFKPANQTCQQFHAAGSYNSEYNWAICDVHTYCDNNNECASIDAVSCNNLCPVKVYIKHRGQDFIFYLFRGTNMIIFIGLLLVVFLITYFFIGTPAGRLIRGK